MFNQPILKGVLFASLLFTWLVSGVSQETTNALFLPTEQDSADHWGEVVDGFQLSIRSDTNVFIRGQPIMITTILRNTTTNLLGVSWTPYFKIVEGESEKAIHTFTNPVADNTPSSGLGLLAPKEQIEEVQDLQRKLSDAKAGTYHIHAEQGVEIDFYSSFFSKLRLPGVGLFSRQSNNVISSTSTNTSTSTNIQSGTFDIQLIDPK